MATFGSDAAYALASIQPVPTRPDATAAADARWKYWEPFMILKMRREKSGQEGLDLLRDRFYTRVARLRKAAIPWETIKRHDLDDPRLAPYPWEHAFGQAVLRRKCRMGRVKGVRKGTR